MFLSTTILFNLNFKLPKVVPEIATAKPTAAPPATIALAFTPYVKSSFLYYFSQLFILIQNSNNIHIEGKRYHTSDVYIPYQDHWPHRSLSIYCQTKSEWPNKNVFIYIYILFEQLTGEVVSGVYIFVFDPPAPGGGGQKYGQISCWGKK